MHGPEQSDSSVVPEKPANKAEPGGLAAESVEGRGLAKENLEEKSRSLTQRRKDLSQALDRVRQAARSDPEMKFTALLHHVYNPDRLRAAFDGLNREAAPGEDRTTWQEYGRSLEVNLQDLSSRIKRGGYRAWPVRRVHIPKPDGGQRPLGIPALGDKIVQKATMEVLNAIYEEDFLGFSYGFRPKRGTQDALDALYVGLLRRKVNWVLDADIRGFFDAVDHEWLVKFIEHRIADKRIVRLIRKWLKAGVIQDGLRHLSEVGVPQGGSISPLLANVYLHHVFDLWAKHWRRHHARGDVVVVRYADDYVVGFQHRWEAERFLADLKDRLQKFGLELHPEKTRLIEFGRFASRDRRKRGEGKPETFQFLGLTHICTQGRNGKFVIKRKTIPARMNRTLARIGRTLRARMHDPVPEVGQWLRAVIHGYFNYHAVPTNIQALWTFRGRLARMWRRVLGRRSQKGYVTWERMQRLVSRWFPPARIRHPWPTERFWRHYPRQEPGAVVPHAGICTGGGPSPAYQDEGPSLP